MPRTIILPLLLLIAAGAVFLLIGGLGDDVEEGDYASLDDEAPPGGDAPPPRIEEGGPALTGTLDGEAPRRTKPRWPVLPTDKIPRGGLHVTPLAPQDEPYSPRDVIVRLEREQTPFWAPPVGVPDYETGIWRFEKVPIGRVRVILFGDHILRTEVRAEIVADKTEKVEVFADRGGALHYQAKLYSGEAPKEVTLRLLDATSKRPVAVYWQERQADAHTTARREKHITMGPDGHAFAIPAGRYVLHAESPEGEYDEPSVEVVLGETVEVEVLIRK